MFLFIFSFFYKQSTQKQTEILSLSIYTREYLWIKKATNLIKI